MYRKVVQKPIQVYRQIKTGWLFIWQAEDAEKDGPDSLRRITETDL